MANRIRRGLALLPLLTLLAPTLLPGQSEDALVKYFEGRTVAVKMDMPANKDGVDVFPGSQPDVNYDQYSKRIKTFGISLHNGDQAPITKIKVKDKLVEFQLAGGGYGTATDEKDTPIIFTPTPKSDREKDLERDLRTEKDAQQRRRMQTELNNLRHAREQQDAGLRNDARVAEEQRHERIMERAVQSGSRFNIQFPDGVQVATLTPDALMTMLAKYVDFSPPNPTPNAAAAAPAVAMAAPAGIRKGMGQDEVDSLLGRPVEVQRSKEGSLDVSRSVYEQGANVIEALFVEGVLVRYNIRSK